MPRYGGLVWVATALVALAAAAGVLAYWVNRSRATANEPVRQAVSVSAEQIRAARDLGCDVVQVMALGKGANITLVLIPTGGFTMGSPASEVGRFEREGPAHAVSVSRAFYLGATEVTQAQWKAVMSTTPWRAQLHPGRADDAAANHISWYDAVDFCRTLTAKLGRKVRLPTEAEWEYACRAGSSGAFCFGDDVQELSQYAWFSGNRPALADRRPQAVALKEPNRWGLYDVHGNVREWCQDWYDESFYQRSPAEGPVGPVSGTEKVERGGWSGDEAEHCRCAMRGYLRPEYGFYASGLRVAVEIEGKAGR